MREGLERQGSKFLLEGGTRVSNLFSWSSIAGIKCWKKASSNSQMQTFISSFTFVVVSDIAIHGALWSPDIIIIASTACMNNVDEQCTATGTSRIHSRIMVIENWTVFPSGRMSRQLPLPMGASKKKLGSDKARAVNKGSYGRLCMLLNFRWDPGDSFNRQLMQWKASYYINVQYCTRCGKMVYV